jgi:hypothetical protein
MHVSGVTTARESPLTAELSGARARRRARLSFTIRSQSRSSSRRQTELRMWLRTAHELDVRRAQTSLEPGHALNTQHAVDGDGARNIPTSDMRHEICADCAAVRPLRSADPAHVRARPCAPDLPRIGTASSLRCALVRGHSRTSSQLDLLSAQRRHSRAPEAWNGTERDDEAGRGATANRLFRPAKRADFRETASDGRAAVNRRLCLRHARLGTARLRLTVLCPLLARPSRTLRAASRCQGRPP